ncbi:diguanylate cyclase [Thiomicrorhabdus sp. ZW0627]|uniref:diguanylate cyclase n=1 Tax=Thiomicrorhabdus sp. ZW0627 TaxID=3039774 RepID=UPI002436D6B9|nr:diguanylate cyclase [Thiomicrorhabdus sp. ZW0627]MDG6774652.1 diguanylate cyclase [Thiomicrorhabdus sp. ZW0627]
MNSRILLIEDQKSIAMLLKARLESELEVEVTLAHSMADTERLLASGEHYDLALSDLTLPDAPNGETVELLRSYRVATVVLTGNYDEQMREKMYRNHVADYVIKEGVVAIDYVVRLLRVLVGNADRQIWIAALSDGLASKLVGLLGVHRFKVKVFVSLKEMLEEMDTEQPDFIIVGEGTDQNESLRYLTKLRAVTNFNELPVLALVEKQGSSMAVKMMKYGANDYLLYPFKPEELYARVTQNIERQMAYKQIKLVSETDGLTGLYNRRTFFQKGRKVFDVDFLPKGVPFVVMGDIDHFKHINDTYGHPKGDEAIRFVAGLFKKFFQDSLAARVGGEEFSVVGNSCDPYTVIDSCEKLRQQVEIKSKIAVGVEFTISLGIVFAADDLESAVQDADKMLYRSKMQGRNCLNFHMDLDRDGLFSGCEQVSV